MVHKYFTGRMIIDNMKFGTKNSKYDYLNFPKMPNKKKDKLETSILTLNTLCQNDVLSGLELISDFKRILYEIFKKFSNKTFWLFQMFLQKLISGNCYRFNYFLLKFIYIQYTSRSLLSEVIKIIKVYDSYDFLIKFQNKSYGILHFFYFFYSETNKKKSVDFLLNKTISRFMVFGSSKICLPFKITPFIVNCPPTLMGLFVFKMSSFRQNLEEHFGFKICLPSREEKKQCIIYNNTENFPRFFCPVNCLLTLQSMEIANYNDQLLTLKALNIFQEFLSTRTHIHPITISIVKKIKSNFFF
jgi:hypothetical protein